MVMTHESGMVTAADGRRCSTALHKTYQKWSDATKSRADGSDKLSKRRRVTSDELKRAN